MPWVHLKNINFGLFIILVLAFALRLPGIFWGVHWNDSPKFVAYESNETTLVEIAREFRDGYVNEDAYYPKGFPFQEALLGKILSRFYELNDSELTLIGRLISAVFGALTVWLIFIVVLELTSNKIWAFLSSLFLSLMSLHVSQSHIATTDVELTFLILLEMYLLIRFLRTDRMVFYFCSVAAFSLALSIKFSYVFILPLLAIMIKKRWNLFRVILIFAAIGGLFYLFNGCHFTSINFFKMLHNVSADNINVRSFNKLLNLFSYAVILLVGIGIPMFLLFIRGIFLRADKEIKTDETILDKDIFCIIFLPYLIQFINICLIGFPAPRHLIVFMPLIAVVSAYGFLSLGRFNFFAKPRNITVLTVFFVCYQLAHTIPVEYSYVFDTRYKAKEWVFENIPEGNSIALPHYSQMPRIANKYKIEGLFEADYVVLHEDLYARYKRSLLNPFEAVPDWGHVFHAERNSFLFCHQVFTGTANYQLVQRFRPAFITPEHRIYQMLLGSPTGAGEVLIYKKAIGSLKF